MYLVTYHHCYNPVTLAVCVHPHNSLLLIIKLLGPFKQILKLIDQHGCHSRFDRTAPQNSHWPLGTSVKPFTCFYRALSCSSETPLSTITSTSYWWNRHPSRDVAKLCVRIGPVEFQSQRQLQPIGRIGRRSTRHCPWIGAAARADSSTGSVFKARGERMSS